TRSKVWAVSLTAVLGPSHPGLIRSQQETPETTRELSVELSTHMPISRQHRLLRARTCTPGNGPDHALRAGTEMMDQQGTAIDRFNRSGVRVPHVCYHPRLGPIQTCDTCLVEVGGKLVRACATQTSDGMVVSTRSSAAKSAQRAAFDRILGNHLLYCTVCDNNNGNCTVHNTTKLLAVEHQRIPFQPKPYAV